MEAGRLRWLSGDIIATKNERRQTGEGNARSKWRISCSSSLDRGERQTPVSRLVKQTKNDRCYNKNLSRLFVDCSLPSNGN